jgi:hypothetical protein
MAKAIKQKELNLLTALDRAQDKGSRRSTKNSTIIVIIVIVAIVLILAGLTVYYFMTVTKLNEEKAEITAYLTDPYTLQQQQESAQARDQAAIMQAQSDALAGAMDSIQSYPDLTSLQLDQIMELSGENVDLSRFSYDRSTGILTLEGTADTAARVPLYVTKLRICGIFSDIAYSGYSAGEVFQTIGSAYIDDEGNEVTDSKTLKVYTFNITALVLAPSEVAELPAEDAEEDAEEAGGDE